LKRIWKNKKTILCLTSVLLAIVIVFGGFFIYVQDYYRADFESIEAFVADYDVKKTVIDDGITTFGNEDAPYGFIFYPGGKVEHTAYEPLLTAVAAGDVFVVLLEMPFHLAVLDMNAAEGIVDLFPKIGQWYIGGHSLGGSMAAYFAQSHGDSIKGLVLLGAYSSVDLSDTDLTVLSLYGSEDGVMNREKYDSYRANLPDDLTEIVLAGGCHAYFGMYGEQKGDGQATLTPEEQIQTVAEQITVFIIEGEV